MASGAMMAYHNECSMAPALKWLKSVGRAKEIPSVSLLFAMFVYVYAYVYGGKSTNTAECFEVGLKHKYELIRYIVLNNIWSFQTKGRPYGKTWICQSVPQSGE